MVHFSDVLNEFEKALFWGTEFSVHRLGSLIVIFKSIVLQIFLFA